MELIIAAIGAIGALAAVVVSLVARRDARRSEADASSAAERATAAAEKMLAMQLTTFDRPPWRVEWFGGDSYLLTNNSPVEATDVVLVADPERLRIQLATEPPWNIGAMSAIKFMYTALLGHPYQRDIVVTWSRPGSDEKFVWRHPIPTKPPKPVEVVGPRFGRSV